MVDMRNELEGKVAIVTGSARNIGRAIAEELAHAGASVVVNAVQAGDLCEEVARSVLALMPIFTILQLSSRSGLTSKSHSSDMHSF